MNKNTLRQCHYVALTYTWDW